MRPTLAAAAAALLAVSLSAATPQGLADAAIQALARGDAEKAAGLLEQAVKLAPGVSNYHLWLAEAYGQQAMKASIFRQPGLAFSARDEMLKAVKLDPDNNDARFGLVDYYMLAPSLLGGGADKARAQAAEIMKRDRVAGHLALARIYGRQKRPDLARKEVQDSVREAPSSARAHYNYANYLLAAREYAAAFPEFETAARLDPPYMPAWFRIGQAAALSSSNLPRGEEALKTYLTWQPQHNEPPLARAWYWLGRVYEAEGRKADARQCYATSLKLTPGAKDVTEAFKRLS